MPDPFPPPPTDPGSALDGTRETLRSGIWVAKPFVKVEAFPEELVLTEADRRLASRLERPVCLCRREIGRHVVEMLLERGEDRSVGLSLRIPTAENQFKDPYILMEAESGNTREVGVREFQFHLQGRLPDADVSRADWAGYFADAARKLVLLREKRRPGKRAKAASRKASGKGRKAAPRKSAARKRRAGTPRRKRR